MTDPTVDVVIPLHRTDRRFDAAVESAQSMAQRVPTRVFVVLHNLHLDGPTEARLRARAVLLRCDDGISSPSGPRNVGLDAATAPYVFFLDSDDELAPRCLRRLVDVAADTGAEVVLPSIEMAGSYVGTPLVWSRTPRMLDVVDDALFTRSHSFALLRRDSLRRSGIRYPEGVRAGQDLVLMAQLYTSCSTAMAFDAVYRLREHAGSRVTTTPLPVADQLAAVEHVLAADWFRRLTPAHREALVHRIVAVNLASGWRRKRQLGHEPSAAAHRAARDVALRHAPAVHGMLSVRDRMTLHFSASPPLWRRLLVTRPFAVVPSSVRGLVSQSGPVFSQARSWLVRHRPRRVLRSSAEPAFLSGERRSRRTAETSARERRTTGEPAP